MKGWLYIKMSNELGVTMWKRRYFALSGVCLYIYQDTEELDPLGCFSVRDYRIVPVGPPYDDTITREYAFKAEHPVLKTYDFSAFSQSDMTRWIDALSSAASLNKICWPSDSRLQPIGQKSEYSTAEVQTREQHAANRGAPPTAFRPNATVAAAAATAGALRLSSRVGDSKSSPLLKLSNGTNPFLSDFNGPKLVADEPRGGVSVVPTNGGKAQVSESRGSEVVPGAGVFLGSSTSAGSSPPWERLPSRAAAVDKCPRVVAGKGDGNRSAPSLPPTPGPDWAAAAVGQHGMRQNGGAFALQSEQAAFDYWPKDSADGRSDGGSSPKRKNATTAISVETERRNRFPASDVSPRGAGDGACNIGHPRLSVDSSGSLSDAQEKSSRLGSSEFEDIVFKAPPIEDLAKKSHEELVLLRIDLRSQLATIEYKSKVTVSRIQHLHASESSVFGDSVNARELQKLLDVKERVDTNMHKMRALEMTIDDLLKLNTIYGDKLLKSRRGKLNYVVRFTNAAGQDGHPDLDVSTGYQSRIAIVRSKLHEFWLTAGLLRDEKAMLEEARQSVLEKLGRTSVDSAERWLDTSKLQDLLRRTNEELTANDTRNAILLETVDALLDDIGISLKAAANGQNSDEEPADVFEVYSVALKNGSAQSRRDVSHTSNGEARNSNCYAKPKDVKHEEARIQTLRKSRESTQENKTLRAPASPLQGRQERRRAKSVSAYARSAGRDDTRRTVSPEALERGTISRCRSTMELFDQPLSLAVDTVSPRGSGTQAAPWEQNVTKNTPSRTIITQRYVPEPRAVVKTSRYEEYLKAGRVRKLREQLTMLSMQTDSASPVPASSRNSTITDLSLSIRMDDDERQGPVAPLQEINEKKRREAILTTWQMLAREVSSKMHETAAGDHQTSVNQEHRKAERTVRFAV